MGAVLDYARNHGDSEFLPLFYIGGALVLTVGGNMDVPEGRPGKVLSITLDAGYRATAAIGAAVEYKVRVTNTIGVETVTRFKGTVARRRFQTGIDEQTGAPLDVLTIDCVSYMAERCRRAPDTQHIIYDANRINNGTTGEAIAQRILDTQPVVVDQDNQPAFVAAALAAALPQELVVNEEDLPFDEDGNRIHPVYEANTGLTLQDLLERCLEDGCGFTDALMTIPDYPIGRLDVAPSGGWYEAISARLLPHEPIWKEDEVANTIEVKQPEWELPEGYAPPELHLSQAFPSISDGSDEIVNLIDVIYRHNGADVAVGWEDYRAVTAPPDETTALTATLIEYAQSLLTATQQAIANDDGGAAVWLAAKAVAWADIALEHAQDDGDPVVIAQAQQIYDDAVDAQADASTLSGGQDDYVFSTTFTYPPVVNIDGDVTTTEWRTDIDFRSKSNPEVILSSQVLSVMRQFERGGEIMSAESLQSYYAGKLKIGHFKSITGKIPDDQGDELGTLQEERCQIQWENRNGEYVQTRTATYKSGLIVTQDVVRNGVPMPKSTPALQANTGQIFSNTEDIPYTVDWGEIELIIERNIATDDGLTLQDTSIHDLVTDNIKYSQSWTRTGKPVVEKKRRRYQYGYGERGSDIGRGVGSHAGTEVRITLKDDASIAQWGVRKADAFDADEMPRAIALPLARLLMQPDPPIATLQLPDPDFTLNRTEVRRIFDRDGDQGLFICTGLSESWGEDQWLSQQATFRKRRAVP
jgi:hypothetical protein